MTPSHTAPTPHAPGRPPEIVLEARDVWKHFDVRSGIGRSSTVRALEEAQVELRRGEIVALVGESGSGKTTLARVMAKFYEPTSGSVLLDGVKVRRGTAAEKDFKSEVQMIFQDPFASLNPMRRVRHNIERALKVHRLAARDKAGLEAQVLALLDKVRLRPATSFIDRLPHELSGGQRQRVVIARALAVEPRVLLGDEPISMLDVSIRLDMLNLLSDLRDDDGLSLLYITHDIASARYIADRICVMYAGQIVETGACEAVIQNPQHPYTHLLLASSPDPERLQQGERIKIQDRSRAGEPPSLVSPPSGCRFHPRCPLAMERCKTEVPPEFVLADGRMARCWLREDGAAAIPGSGPHQDSDAQ